MKFGLTRLGGIALAAILATTVLVVSFSPKALADEKIGVVDIPRAIQATKEGQRIKKELDADFQRRKAELEKRKDAIVDMEKNFEKRNLLLSDQARAQQEQKIEKAKMQFFELRDQNLKALAKRDQELSKPLLKRLGKVIDEIARKGGYTAIFHKDDQDLVWASSRIDITNKVIKALEKKH